ncbi:MAG: Panacea domain-containing protein [Candidatus Weimeria sp.]
MVTAEELAGYITSKCIRDRCPITNMQLQKILYLIQTEYIGHGSLAFEDNFEAWSFGPAIPEIYYKYGVFGADTIDICLYDFSLSEKDAAIIDPMVESLREDTPWTLSQKANGSGSPWEKVYCSRTGNRKVIPKELISSSIKAR